MSADAGATPSPAKRLRSMEPDLTVIVGEGEQKEEFQCYSAILCTASDYIDAMLSSSMQEANEGKIKLPHRNPVEWPLFYQFIDPSTMRHHAKITDDNVMILVPWFSEFGMANWLDECDVTLGRLIASLEYGNDVAGPFETVLQYLKDSELYELKKSKATALSWLVKLLTDVVHIRAQLIPPLLPFLLQTGCDKLWSAVKPYLPDALQDLDVKDFCEQEMYFIHLVTQGIKLAKALAAIAKTKAVAHRSGYLLRGSDIDAALAISDA